MKGRARTSAVRALLTLSISFATHLAEGRFAGSPSQQFCITRCIRSAHVLCVDTGRSSETAKAHRG
eukprot:TRINITY_DN7085_c0_g1_i1.p1 TRINITY_DN7085_c0_g1~~TRINITY_DN7085_c0_g1_i1.p1  ORF type:complete len:66 (+),score=12.91 TRINITY_DN7085_c0_g1_i1:100-297(+)